uniref:Uncharacterized protein n=1 Tax=Nelumbo nucifera TaxID=4432 RepID=A0A822YPY9_NELNU|nr:TPA_asm: hypothetical protein HUJ06_004803 [Nelumbo nucifera]
MIAYGLSCESVPLFSGDRKKTWMLYSERLQEKPKEFWLMVV